LTQSSGEEGLENSVQVLNWNSLSMIVNAQQEPAVTCG
jgi:hypothetical protein